MQVSVRVSELGGSIRHHSRSHDSSHSLEKGELSFHMKCEVKVKVKPIRWVPPRDPRTTSVKVFAEYLSTERLPVHGEPLRPDERDVVPMGAVADLLQHHAVAELQLSLIHI